MGTNLVSGNGVRNKPENNARTLDLDGLVEALVMGTYPRERRASQLQLACMRMRRSQTAGTHALLAVFGPERNGHLF